MKSSQIRQLFLDYFVKHGHVSEPSSSVVPKHDKTLLFTNAGMVPFKNVFLGLEDPAHKQVTSAQLCIRAGGKHNDLENVGFTLRHHTLFEMLGNFSFGAYFKQEAIELAWNFLTKELSIPAEKLWVTVYKDDDEAATIWQDNIGVPKERIIRCGDADNFWSMGDTGPCGPCSEIFYDHGPTVAGGPPGSPDAEGDRYVEIWNLVFMQYNRASDGELLPLEVACVDTGMGLERVAAVMQGVADNYATDVFQPLLKSLSTLLQQTDLTQPAMRVIVDHIRSAAFMIACGVTPSNEGRGYVLRHIIRRALRYGYKLGEKQPFFYQMVAPLVLEMGAAYPILEQNKSHIEQVLKTEEHMFSDTLSYGLKLLEAEIQQLSGNTISGAVVFKLYDTYGFPADLTADIARERNLSIDFAEFEQHLQRQRENSKSHAKFSADYTQQLHIKGKTEFIGYEQLSGQAVIEQILHDSKPLSELSAGQDGTIILDRTPFYAEGGGQVGDCGRIITDEASFVVTHTTKLADTYLHYGRLEQGRLRVADQVRAAVDDTRQAVACNHTATHLLHAALRQVLGEHVQQKGSLVTAQRLRFDFTHSSAVTVAQRNQLEQLVNEQIRLNLAADTSLKTLDEARDAGAIALFDEKYTEEVRVLKLGEFSHEVCGGTHVKRTGDIGCFKIIAEAAVAAGVRRLEAVTAASALEVVQANQALLDNMSSLLKIDTHGLPERLNSMLQQLHAAEQEYMHLKKQMIALQSHKIIESGQEINDVFVLACKIDDADKDGLMFLADTIKSRFPQHAAVLASVNKENKVVLVATVGKATTQYFKAGDMLANMARHIDGRGGGRPTLAQGGGNKPENLVYALADVKNWIRHKLQ